MEQKINRLKHFLGVLDEARFVQKQQIGNIYCKYIDYNQRETIHEPITEPGWVPFENGQLWGGKDVHTCFQTDLLVTEEMEGQDLYLFVSTGATDIWNTDNPQFLFYLNDQIICGMDMNHHEVCIKEHARAGEKIHIGIYAYSNSDAPTDYLRIDLKEKRKQVDQLYYDCKVPFETVLQLREDNLDRMHMIELLNATMNRVNLCYVGDEAFLTSTAEADAWLQREFYDKLDGKSAVTVHSIGHTHIDVAWKWPVRQTREKTVRSFSTVLHLMEEYPAYRFMSSQPQLYQFVKEDAPEIYEQIKKRVAEGRWETEGAMWLEADCNLTCGESLVRQIIHGKRFFKEEFHTPDNRILWLPDVFGYSAALPQILKLSNIEYFMTTKINWNEYNKFPNDVMMWKGIDGTEILTYFISTSNHQVYPELSRSTQFNTTYNGRQNVSQVMGTWQRFSNKDLTNEVLTCYGFGDGGGGPTTEMMEEDLRMAKGIPGCPVTKQTFAIEFFDGLRDQLENKKVPKWNGELYLEFHRGTYTSMAKNKKYNRKCEFKNQDVEFFSVWAMLENNAFSYPADQLDSIWKTTLLNQFHDTLPGSAIEEVYQVTEKEYEEILQEDADLINAATNVIVENQCMSESTDGCMEKTQHEDVDQQKTENQNGDGKQQQIILYNTLSFSRDELVEIPCDHQPAAQAQKLSDGKWLVLAKQIPQKGYRKIALEDAYTFKNIFEKHNESQYDDQSNNRQLSCTAEQSEDGISVTTPFFKAKLDQNGELVSVYDLEEKREVARAGEPLNRLMAFEDRPYEYDAWNIDAYYEEKSWNLTDLQEMKITEKGPLRTVIYLRRHFLQSVVEQEICFYAHSKRVDFKTRVDWKEQQILLKAAFPVDVMTNKVICDIQFGNVERPTHRNTSWDEARFEFCAHKWVDVAEAGYGVALLNDCKYGLDVQESTMRLTLLKSGIFPNPNADKEVHTFTYALYPHTGDFRKGRVVQEAFQLNEPVYVKTIAADPVKQVSDYDSDQQKIEGKSLFSIDQENVISETFKLSEDGKSVILRAYECYGERVRTTISFDTFKPSRAEICNLLEETMEDKKAEMTYENGALSFWIYPYEIKTFRLTYPER